MYVNILYIITYIYWYTNKILQYNLFTYNKFSNQQFQGQEGRTRRPRRRGAAAAAAGEYKSEMLIHSQLWILYAKSESNIGDQVFLKPSTEKHHYRSDL